MKKNIWKEYETENKIKKKKEREMCGKIIKGRQKVMNEGWKESMNAKREKKKKSRFNEEIKKRQWRKMSGFKEQMERRKKERKDEI